jgi:hypothetical protein
MDSRTVIIANSGAGESGCKAPLPVGNSGGPGSQPDLSSGRYPDGTDPDSNCSDFLVQKSTAMLNASNAGANNLKISSVSGFRNGQRVIIDKGNNAETAFIAIIGTTGGTTVGTATSSGATVIPVVSTQGFNVGQNITIGDGTNMETAVITAITSVRGFMGAPGSNSITVASPLNKAHAVGAQVSGSGITFSKPLTKAHAVGNQIAGNIPTRGTQSVLVSLFNDKIQ